MTERRRALRSVAVLAIAACVALGVVPLTITAADASDDTTGELQTPVLSVRRVPNVMFGAVADPKFIPAISSYLDKVAGTTCSLITENGRLIYARNTAESLAPASTIKVLTATVALEVLGPDTRLRTTVVSAAPTNDGVVSGDVYIVGGGDPLLVTAGYRQSLDNPDQLTTDFARLADAVASSGVREIRGIIFGDDSRHDRTRWLPTWPTRYQIGGVVGPLSALMVNDGQTGFVDQPDRPNPERRAGDPPALAAATLKTLLGQRGVQVIGSAGAATAPTETKEIAGLDSASIREIVGEMMTDSDNTTAELLAREIGLKESGQPTSVAGVEAIRSVIERLGLPLDGSTIVDGSGLDPANRLTCPLLVDALTRLPSDSPIISGLAIAGRTGTLRKRMLNTSAAGKVRAKTGTLNNVNALVGFAEAKAGMTITFSMIENGVDPRGTGVTDGFAERLVTFGDGPPLSSLGPLPLP